MTDFAQQLLAWFALHGRKDLPWQQTRDPYAIWVSEIMLQQTQVAAVIPYFLSFMRRFPNIVSLASAPLDSVLQQWTGLGYYARARNLQSAAQTIVAQHAGVFPRDYDAVCALPGIGPSTAAAILAFADDQPRAILDGNVKRVLARYHRVDGWPGQASVATQLWTRAREHTPAVSVRAYTQAIMDLGATVCRRTPQCQECPVRSGCAAYAAAEVTRYPQTKPRKTLPVRATTMLMIHNRAGELLLEQRPLHGIWGGLWGFPECGANDDPMAYIATRWGWRAEAHDAWSRTRHTFTHFHLDIVPLPLQLLDDAVGIMDASTLLWHAPHAPLRGGVSAPVKRILEQLRNNPWPAPLTA